MTLSGRTKVLILGFTNSRTLAPIDNPDHEVWSLNDLYLDMGLPSDRLRWFQLHAWKPEGDAAAPPHPRDPCHVLWLQAAANNIPVYLKEARPEVPKGIVYPFEEAYKLCPEKYYTNSISWMIALAIIEGFTEIGVYGVDMMAGGGAGSEYGWQRPSVEYFLGLARGRGITVTIPVESDLLKSAFVYGDDKEGVFRRKLNYELTRIKEQVAQHEGDLSKITGALNHCRGYKANLEWMLRSWMPGDSDTPTRGRSPLPHSHMAIAADAFDSDQHSDGHAKAGALKPRFEWPADLVPTPTDIAPTLGMESDT